MEQDGEDEAPGNEVETITGDVIGNTVYSQQFVIKLLLRFTKLDTLKNELADENVLGEYCLLWNMSVNKDVVLFLLQYDTLNLFKFAWPYLDSPRMIEIVIGTIGNMCCEKETVDQLSQNEELISRLVHCIKTDDSLILIQLLRLINSCLYLSDENLEIWMRTFVEADYSTALYYILNNSVKKDVLAASLENVNTICSKFNTETFRTDFFQQFVKSSALGSLCVAFTEIYTNHKESFFRIEFERIIYMIIKIIKNLIEFEQSSDIFKDSINDVLGMIFYIFLYYRIKIVNEKEIDIDFSEILDSTKAAVKCLNLSVHCDFECFCLESSKIWSALYVIIMDDNACESDDVEELKMISKKLIKSISELILLYLEVCSEDDLYKALDTIGSSFEDVLASVDDSNLVASVSTRACDYRNRLIEMGGV